MLARRLSSGEGLGEGFLAEGFVGFIGKGELGVGKHRGEDIVKFVGDHGRDHTQRGQFVLLGEALLQLVNSGLQRVHCLQQ